jgi:crossover junction endodeoxyribonuclease RuvC
MAKLTVRQMWKAKVEGRLSPPSATHPLASLRGNEAAIAGGAAVPLRRAYAGSVLGIDPSLRGTGLALVEFGRGAQPILLHCRTVKVPSSRTFAEALAEIHRAVTDALSRGNVRHVALEQTIYVQNIRTAQILGAARGAAVAAAALAGLPVFEYPPLRVKEAVVGVGRASKEQMARTVMAHLGHARPLAYDEADAAGVALCHAFTWREG